MNDSHLSILVSLRDHLVEQRSIEAISGGPDAKRKGECERSGESTESVHGLHGFLLRKIERRLINEAAVHPAAWKTAMSPV